MKKQSASLVEAELKKPVSFEDKNNDEEKYIMSMVQAAITMTLNQKMIINLRPNLKFPSNLFSSMLRTMAEADNTQWF